MENIKRVDNETTVAEITVNYANTIESIKARIIKNNYVLRVEGVEVTPDMLDAIKIDLNNLTKSGRKKVAKRLWIYKAKGTLKSINFLFRVLLNMLVIEEKVSVKVSHKEAEIIKSRKAYVKLRTEAEAARVLYKETKGDFYKK